MVSLVLCPMVMNRSLRALAMSVGSVYVMFSYMMVVGGVRCCDRDGFFLVVLGCFWYRVIVFQVVVVLLF